MSLLLSPDIYAQSIMTIREALAEAAPLLPATNASRDASTLLAHTLLCNQAWLRAYPETELTSTQAHTFQSMIHRRAGREPLQYITGQQEFYGLNFRVTPSVLIPRPETEHLVEAVLLWATQFQAEQTLQIADIGTGSGAIAIALATHLAGARFVATDISDAALAIARQNALAHGCDQRIQFVHSDLLSGIETAIAGGFRFDAVLSNPPYIPADDAATMQPEVIEHEPHTALFAGPDGLDIYRLLIPTAYAALRERGLLALEIGYGQRDALATLLADWDDLHFIDDYAGIPRVAMAVRR